MSERHVSLTLEKLQQYAREGGGKNVDPPLIIYLQIRIKSSDPNPSLDQNWIVKMTILLYFLVYDIKTKKIVPN